MRKPLLISLVFHALILIFAVVTFPTFGEKLPPVPTPMPVDLVTPAELTKIKAGKRDAKTETAKADTKPSPPAAKEAPKPVKAKSVKAPAPKPSRLKSVKAPEPKAEKSEPTPKEAAKPEKKAALADPGPVPAPSRKPKKSVSPPERKLAAKKSEDFDPDKIAALLNKASDAGPKTTTSTQPGKKREPAKGRTEGRDVAMTFNEIDALRARISQCWNPPVGGMGADAIQIKLRLQLTERGSLTNPPQVVNRALSPYFQAAADAAVRAVMLCQPYQLPPRKYALWRDMILNFDPREMFGG